MKFGIGQPMRRHEDLRLITGRGCYTDDVILPRMTHAFVLRSPVAHAHIKRIDTAAGHRKERSASAVRKRIGPALAIVDDESLDGHGLHCVRGDANSGMTDAGCGAE
jgi:hypothetical protein